MAKQDQVEVIPTAAIVLLFLFTNFTLSLLPHPSLSCLASVTEHVPCAQHTCSQSTQGDRRKIPSLACG